MIRHTTPRLTSKRMIESLLAGVLIGLAGTAHCLAMCGPLAASVSLNFSPDRRLGRANLTTLMSIGAGKVGLYTLLGAVAGVAGQQLMLAGALMPLLLLSGVFLIAMGLYGFGIAPPTRLFRHLLTPISVPLRTISRRVTPINSAARALAWGMAWGLLPCGLVYAALGWSLTQPNALAGAAGMLGFGLGTLPAALGSGYLGSRLGRAIKTGGAARISGALLIAMGLLSITLGVAQG